MAVHGQPYRAQRILLSTQHYFIASDYLMFLAVFHLDFDLQLQSCSLREC